MPRTQAVVPAAQKLATLRDHLKNEAWKIGPLVPKHLTPERLLATASVALSRSPLLLECTIPSVLRAVAIGAQMGLDVSGVGGQGYLVPYRNSWNGKYEAQFFPGYQGLIDLALRSQKVVAVRAKEVYALDHFEYEEGSLQRVFHKPNLTAERGELVAVYAVAHLANGFPQAEVMSAGDVERVRKHSRAGDKGPWNTDPAMMWRKSAVRRLCKYLPQNPDLARAIDIEDRLDAGEEPAPAAGEEVVEEFASEGNDAVKGKLGIVEPEPEAEGEAIAEEREPGEEG